MKSAIIKEFLAHQETIAKVIETMQVSPAPVTS